MSNATEKPRKIIELTAENVKRLKAVRIQPTGSVTVIGGKNAQGKTSLLDAVAFGLAGKRQGDTNIVREGEDKATVVLDLGDITITRTRSKAGNEKVVIQSKEDKATFPSPQAMLDNMTKRNCIDPLAFIRMDPKARLDLLRKLTGLDFTETDAEIKRIYDERTEVNREVKRLRNMADEYPVPTTKLEWKDRDPVEKEIASVKELQREAEFAAQQYREVHDKYGKIVEGLGTLRHRLALMEQEMVTLKERIKAGEASEAKTQAQLKEQNRLAEEAKANVPEVKDLFAKLEEIDRHNGQVHTEEKRQETLAQLKKAEAESEEGTKAIAHLEKTKRDMLAKAPFPIPGLSMDGSDVTFNEQPFNQASGAEQLRASVAISAALNPSLPVMLIRDGSLLDSESMEALIEMAAEMDLQIFIERVEVDRFVSIEIEDGTVVKTPDAGNGPTS